MRVLSTGRVVSKHDTVSRDDDDVLCGAASPDGRVVVTGGTSNMVKVYRVTRNVNKRVFLELWAYLRGHSSDVVAVAVSQEWSVIVSGARDGGAIVWDLNRLAYVRTIGDRLSEDEAVSVVAISPVSGNIFIGTRASSPAVGGGMHLWTINGERVASATLPPGVHATSAQFTWAAEGVHDNVIVCGLSTGQVQVRKAFDMQYLLTLEDAAGGGAITSLAMRDDMRVMWTGDAAGRLVEWEVEKAKG